MLPDREVMCWMGARADGRGGDGARRRRREGIRNEARAAGANPGGRQERAITIPVNLIYKGEAPDVALIDGDILYVPTSNGRLATEQAITSALGIGTSVAFIRPPRSSDWI